SLKCADFWRTVLNCPPARRAGRPLYRFRDSLTARPPLVPPGFLATRANRTRRSFPLLRRKFQVLSDPSPEGPILASVFNQHNRCIARCHSCLACEKTGHSRVERFLLFCRPTSAQEHLHEHDPVGSLDAEVARIIQKATCGVLRNNLETITLGSVQALDKRAVDCVSDGHKVCLRATLDKFNANRGRRR